LEYGKHCLENGRFDEDLPYFLWMKDNSLDPKEISEATELSTPSTRFKLHLPTLPKFPSLSNLSSLLKRKDNEPEEKSEDERSTRSQSLSIASLMRRGSSLRSMFSGDNGEQQPQNGSNSGR
jgi:hypothetical protein